MPTLKEKLDLVRFMRPYYPWLMGLGISKKTIGDIKNGEEPESEALISALVNCENVSREWLINDVEPPFQVATIESDDECSEALQAYLNDEQWTVYILNDGYDQLIVLTLPGQHARPRQGFIDFTVVEILPNAGEKAIDVAYQSATQLMRREINSDTFERIKTGQIGTYWLTNPEKPTGILVRAEAVPIGERKERLQAIKNNVDYSKNTDMYHVHDSSVNNNEKVLLENYRLLTDENKKLVQAITRNLR